MKTDDIISQIKELPATARIVPHLLEVLKNPEAMAEDLVDLIRLDANLSAQLIKLSNSGYYGNPKAHADLKRAIAEIGLRETARIVLGIISCQLSAHPNPAYEIEDTQLWDTSIAAAICMEMLAEDAHGDLAQAYSIGLFHNIGKVVISNIVGKDYHRVFEELEDRCQAEVERALFGLDYPEVGARLLHEWQFPASIYDPIRHQLNPLKEAEHRDSASMLHITLHILSNIGLAHGRSAYALCAIDETMNLLYLNEHKIQALMDEVPRRINTIRQKLDLV